MVAVFAAHGAHATTWVRVACIVAALTACSAPSVPPDEAANDTSTSAAGDALADVAADSAAGSETSGGDVAAVSCPSDATSGGDALACDDDNPCTDDCELGGTCAHLPLAEGTNCGVDATCDGSGHCLLAGVVEVGVGTVYACARLNNGKVRCWGGKVQVQPGVGTLADSSRPWLPVALPDVPIQLAIGDLAHCAVLSKGALACWNSSYPLNLGSSGPGKATVVPGLESGVKAAVVGLSHLCVLRDSGDVECLGTNFYGQLGDGTTQDRVKPAPVKGIDGKVAGMAVGNAFSCALLTNGKVKCWGNNSAGQLGDGTTSPHLEAVEVLGLGGAATAISAAYGTTCALLANGKIRCWGGMFIAGYTPATTPVTMPLPVAVHQVVVGTDVCGVDAAGAYYCVPWGDEGPWAAPGSAPASGQWPNQPAPLLMARADRSWGQQHDCAVLANGRAYCWGSNVFGGIGDGTSAFRNRAEDVEGAGPGPAPLTAGPNYGVVADANGTLLAWGAPPFWKLNSEPWKAQAVTSGPKDITRLSAAMYHVCLVTQAGQLWCAGANWSGQLGLGAVVSTDVPMQVAGLPAPATDVATGDDHSCALLTNGSVHCWGSNMHGQLGTGDHTNHTTPVVATLAGAPAIALDVRGASTCIVTTTGEVRCWGKTVDTGFADNLAPAPVAFTLKGLAGKAVDVTLGAFHLCVLLSDGKVDCAGPSYYGAVPCDGHPTYGADATPRHVVGLPGKAASIASSTNATCATVPGHGVYCWGRFPSQLIGAPQEYGCAMPFRIEGLDGKVTNLTLGTDHGCALADGKVRCFGQGAEWQNGSPNAHRFLPTAVVAPAP